MNRFAPSSVRIALTLLALTLSLAAFTQAATHASSAAQLRPQRLLDEVPSPMPYPWVIGKDWPRHTTVTLTVHYRGAVGHAGLRTGSDGAFGVAIEGCAGARGWSSRQWTQPTTGWCYMVRIPSEVVPPRQESRDRHPFAERAGATCSSVRH
jgi:hypothetical protein